MLLSHKQGFLNTPLLSFCSVKWMKLLQIHQQSGPVAKLHVHSFLQWINNNIFSFLIITFNKTAQYYIYYFEILWSWNKADWLKNPSGAAQKWLCAHCLWFYCDLMSLWRVWVTFVWEWFYSAPARSRPCLKYSLKQTLKLILPLTGELWSELISHCLNCVQ